jgi:hypothetical protein
MRRLLCFIFAVAAATLAHAAGSDAAASNQLLFVHDSATAAEPLLEFLRTRGHFEITVVDQAHLPADWAGYRAVLGYIHNKLLEPTEVAIIEYTKKGGRFIALHHMISSGKADNRFYFDFLGIRLDDPKASRNPVSPGDGYGWYTGPAAAAGGEAGISYTLVKLHPDHFIVSHDVTWPDKAVYQSSDALAVSREYPAIVLPKAEAYMNHKFTDGRAKTVLCGMKYTDPRTGTVFQQDRMGWVKSYGAGRIVYLQPGHFADEFRNPNISQMVLNAIIWDGTE